MNTYGIILAGGGGTRFWPLSRQKTPKQLLNLTGKELMVNEAIGRLSYIVKQSDIFIVTNESQVPTMLTATEGRIQPNHILSEPIAKNTAACIGYSAMEIIKKYSDGVMIITPSDHFIKDSAAFTRILNIGVKIAEQSNKIVTIGITPSNPSTGYGYIKFDDTSDETVKNVIEFSEKPNEVDAKKYIASGNYVWNSGIFICKASLILDMFREFVPDIYENLLKIGDAMGSSFEREMIDYIYPNIRKISVDYAIMEPSSSKGNVLVIPAEFGWNDVGSWDMMDVLYTPDANGNVQVGDTLALNTRNCILYSSGKTVAVVGVENLVVVETVDAIMVCQKDKAQDVKLIVDTLHSAGRKELL